MAVLPRHALGGGHALTDDRCVNKFLPDGSTMLMRPNRTAIHGRHYPCDMAVRMREVLARPWFDV